MSIKSWPNQEKPRERLAQQGPDVLSEAELLAILLRSGIRGKDATALAREMLQTFGGLRGLLTAGAAGLQKIKGLGPAKIATLLAASEIAKRQLKSEMIGKNVIRDPQSVLNYLTLSLRDLKREVFKVLFLNKGNRIMCEKDLFEGTVDEAAVHPREVVKAALEQHATSLILVHNHPSGRIDPSPEDREITRKLQAACATISVRILDHIIIGDNQYFSFNEHQIL
ncbi:MAG: DNA repair protein RadC [Candidatus Omnitrophica bacterium]|nr:DNA repair protein RadC [Candidatus Omnitrophota bacterium]